MQKANRRIEVFGRVQGVFFRASTKSKADELGVKGFAKNQTDGSVLIEAEGSEQQIETFANWCKKGPETALVTKCKIAEGKLKNYERFEIRY